MLIVDLFDILVVYIGIGFCGWLVVVEGWGLVNEFLELLLLVWIIFCGLKVIGVLCVVGLCEEWFFDFELLYEVLEYLFELGVFCMCIVV